VHLASSAQEAHGMLVLDTDNAAQPHAQVKVTFTAPQ
jgi:hypothetical protein